MTRRRTPRSLVPPGCADQRALLRALVRDKALVPRDDLSSYDVSYPEFLGYFHRCGPLTKHHLIIAANFAYGWMPTILDFHSREFDTGVAHLEKARAGSQLTVSELAALAKIVNKSMVGASKLLHFASPAAYAIWDSRVAKYLGARIDSNDRAAEQYFAYNDCVLCLGKTREAEEIAREMGDRVGYAVAPMRALELVMFHAGRAGLSYFGSSSSYEAR